MKYATLWLVLLAFMMPVHAAQEAAQVILARSAEALGADGTTRALSRRDKIFVGDTLSTASDGMLQVRFVDKAMLTLRESSRFRIEAYAPPANGGGNVLMELLEGGFRTITGSIGKGSQDAYKVTAGEASIGIRGTHYEVIHETATAIVLAVWEGGIKVSNDEGSLDLGADAEFSYSRVESGHAPVGLLTPPPAFEQGPLATLNVPSGVDSADSEASAAFTNVIGVSSSIGTTNVAGVPGVMGTSSTLTSTSTTLPNTGALTSTSSLTSSGALTSTGSLMNTGALMNTGSSGLMAPGLGTSTLTNTPLPLNTPTLPVGDTLNLPVTNPQLQNVLEPVVNNPLSIP